MSKIEEQSKGRKEGEIRYLTPLNIETNNKKKQLELCSSVIGENREPGKFGMRCIYAHHENDLRLTTLFERDDAGLIDKGKYRARPCFSHISTGCW